MSEEKSEIKNFKTLLLLPALLLGMSLAFTVNVFFSTLLVDMAASFKVSIGTASQLGLISSIIGLIMGFAMFSLSIKFQHKSLFLFGIAIFGIGTLGFFLAQNFATLLLFQSFIGVGSSIIVIMIYTLIGELFSLEKRGWAVGLAVAAMGASYIIVGPFSGLISDIAGWRSVLLWLIFPFSLACFALGSLVVPSKQPQLQSPTMSLYSKAFRQILLNKSAMACVIGTTLFTCVGVVPFYAVSFYRLVFAVSPFIGGVFSSIAAVGAILGGIGGGRLINRCGRKPLTVAASLVSGISAIIFSYMPNMLISVAFWVISAGTAAIAVSALFSLALEQVPSFKGSMMSINSIFQNTGTILGLIIGGLVLNIYYNDFQLLMTIFGTLGIASAPIIFLLAKDPCERT